MNKKVVYLILFVLIGLRLWLGFVGLKAPNLSTPIHQKEVDFSELSGWNNTDHRQSFKAFLKSCGALLHQPPDARVGSPVLDLKAKDWFPVCEQAKHLKKITSNSTRLFFEHWFHPVSFYQSTPVKGLFTGYFSVSLPGSLTKTAYYSVPIYANPSDKIDVNLGLFDSMFMHRRLVGRLEQHHLVPYYTRSEINHGAVDKTARIIAFVHSEFDRMILEIEGSGALTLPDGRVFYLGYAGTNGHKYTSVANYFIKHGILRQNDASYDAMRLYLNTHPKESETILNTNASFVFFTTQKKHHVTGAQGVVLTPGYSMAVDRQWIPLGVPLWLETDLFDETSHEDKPFRRLMIAQDTGGAIKGAVRGDIYWGSGEKAMKLANSTQNRGVYVLLLPKTINLN